MNKKLFFEKGYTLEVESWENDGDNYKTKLLNMKTKEEAIEVRKMCKEIFISSSNRDGGIGNMMDDEGDLASYVIINYLIKNQKLLKINNVKTIKDMKKDILKAFPGEATKADYKEYAPDYYEENKKEFSGWIDMIMTYNIQLLGGSEYYYSRVFESSTLYHSPENIYLKIII